MCLSFNIMYLSFRIALHFQSEPTYHFIHDFLKYDIFTHIKKNNRCTQELKYISKELLNKPTHDYIKVIYFLNEKLTRFSHIIIQINYMLPP